MRHKVLFVESISAVEKVSLCSKAGWLSLAPGVGCLLWGSNKASLPPPPPNPPPPSRLVSSRALIFIFQRVSPTLSYTSHLPGIKTHLPQGISLYPPNRYEPFFMIVIVWFFQSHLLRKVLAAQPWVEACQHRAQLLLFPIAGERNCFTTVEITSGWKTK